MKTASQKEIQESIQELIEYRNRLSREILTVSKKLGMPKSKIDASLTEHMEINQIDEMIDHLTNQLEKE